MLQRLATGETADMAVMGTMVMDTEVTGTTATSTPRIGVVPRSGVDMAVTEVALASTFSRDSSTTITTISGSGV